MRRNGSLACLSVFVAVAMSGCGGTQGTDSSTAPDAPGGSEPAVAKSTLLAKVDVGYGTLEFTKSSTPEGDAVFGIAESSSAYARSTPFRKLVSDKQLTMLEVFLAVAPDQEPPQDLVTNHPAEAKELGRANADIQHVTFDKNAPIEKSLQVCEGGMFPTPSDPCYSWGNFLEPYMNSSTWVPVGTSLGDWGHNTMQRVTVGICNDTATATGVQRAWSVDNGAWQYDPPSSYYSVPAYTWYAWISFYVSRVGPDCTGSPICVPVSHPARYGVHQQGGPWDWVMTGEWVWNHLCDPR